MSSKIDDMISVQLMEEEPARGRKRIADKPSVIQERYREHRRKKGSLQELSDKRDRRSSSNS